MSTTVDNKVVRMQFDNQRFESNVNQTRSSLDKLKKSLIFDSNVESFQNIGKAANNVNLSNLETNVGKIQRSFSTLGVIGRAAITNLTNSVVNFGKSFTSSIFRLAASGGISRAMNIEQARFQIQGLGKNWNKLKEDILYGVEDTAYGFDEAAKAAAVMAASGVKAGDEMKGALRGISGLAAMTGSSYTEVSDIVGTIAGQGVVMTEQLRQFEHRGINVAAQLAKSMGKSEAAIREMASKGKISFKDFANVMDDAWGAHAKDASKMFTGAASNIKASLSRIGAAFVQPAIATVETSRKYKNLTDVFRSVIDALKAFEDKLNNSQALKTYMGLLDKASTIASNFFDAISGDTVEKDKDGNIISVIKKQSEKWAELRKSMGLTKTTFKNLGDTFKGVGSAIKIISRLVKGLADFLAPIFSSIGTVVLSVTGAIGRFITGLEQTTAKAKGVQAFFSSISQVVSSLIKGFGNVISKLLGVNEGVKQVSSIFDSIGKKIGSVGDIVTSVFKGISIIIDSVFSGISEVLSGKGVGHLTEILNTVFAGGILMTLSEIGVRIANFLSPWAGFMKTSQRTFNTLNGTLGQVKNTFVELQTSVKAQAIKQIAIALAIFAGSLFILASINPKRLDSALAGMAALLFEVNVMITSLAKKDFTNINGLKLGALAISMIGVAAAIAILAGVATRLAKLDMEGLYKGLGGATILLKAMSMMMNSMQGKTIDIKSMGGLIAMSYAIKILSSVAKELGVLNIEDLAKGLGSVGILMKAMAQMMTHMGRLKTLDMGALDAKSMLSLIALAGAIKILGSVVSDIAKLDIQGTVQGLISVGILMKAVTVFAKSMDKTTVSIKSMLGIVVMAGALKLLASVVGDLASIRIDKLATGLIGIAALLFMMSKAMNSISGVKNMQTTALGMIVVSGAIYILAKSLEAVSGISWEGLAKGLIAIAGSLLIMTKVMKVISVDGVKGAAAMVIMAAALRILVPVLTTLGKMSGKQVVTALLALAGAFTVLGVAAFAMSGIILPLIGLAAAIALLGVAAFAVGAGLSSFAAGLLMIVNNAGKMLEGIPVLVKVWGAFLDSIKEVLPKFALMGVDLLVSFLEGIKKSAPRLVNVAADIVVLFLDGFAKKIPMVVDAAFNFVGELVKAIVEGIDKFAGKIQEGGKAIKAETFKMISDALLELSAAIFIMSKIPITGAITAIAGFAVFANGLGLLLVELGAISKIPGLKYFINEGGKLLGAIGSAIGQLVGGLIGGIGMGVTSAMVNMAENLSDFMNKLKPFLEGAKSINPATMVGVKAVADVIYALTAAKLMDSLSKLPTLGGIFGGGTFETLANDINAFVPAFDSFAAAGEEISDESIKGIQRVAKGAKAIIGLSKEIPNQGGLSADIFGDNTLAQFAEGLSPFIKSFSKAAEASMEIKEDSIQRVKNVAKAATALINMAKEIPNQGGLVTMFTGDNNLMWFAEDIAAFGEKFSELSSSVAEVTDAQIEKIKSVAKAAKTLADVAVALPVVEIGFFESKTPVGLDTFAKSLGTFGTQFTTFATSVADLSDGDIAKASSVGKAAVALANVAKSLPKEKSGLFSSEKTQGLGSFAKNLGTFGDQFKKFISKFKDVSQKQVDKVGVLSKAISALSKLGKLDTKGVTAISSLSNKLPDIGSNVAGYASSLKDVDAKGATSANKFLPTLIKVLKQSDGVKNIISGAALSSFGKGVKSYANSISGIKTKDLSSATSAVKKSLSNIKSAVKGANLADSFKHVGSNAGKALANAIGKHTNAAFKAAKNVANSGLRGAKAVSFKSAGENASEGYAQGVKNKSGLVYSAVESVVKEAYRRGKKAQKSKSPSKLYAGLGEWAGEGYANGVYRTAGLIKKAVSSVIGEGSGTAKKMSMALSSILDSDDLSQPVIRPVMDLSDVKMGVQSMSSMLGSEYAIGLAGSIPVNSNGAVQSIRNSNVTTNVTNEFTINDVENGRQFVQEFSDILGVEARRK